MHPDYKAIVELAFHEDLNDPKGLIPSGDHSALACLDNTILRKAHLLVKAKGVIAGIDLAKVIFHHVDPNIRFTQLMKDGDRVQIGDIAFIVEGPAPSVLIAERTALNFMQRMSATASITRQFVDLTNHTKAKILDTRKTTPGMRALQKYAVRMGGGHNHRMGLYDMVMLKDNHNDFCGGIQKAVAKTKAYLAANQLDLKIEVETRNIDEVKQCLAIHEDIDRIMLDNFNYEEVRNAVRVIDGLIEVEVSGNINLHTVKNYAECGPDFISVGALTHSAGCLDLSLKAVKE